MADRRNAEKYGSIQPNFYYVMSSLFSFPNMVVKQTKFTSVKSLKVQQLVNAHKRKINRKQIKLIYLLTVQITVLLSR